MFALLLCLSTALSAPVAISHSALGFTLQADVPTDGTVLPVKQTIAVFGPVRSNFQTNIAVQHQKMDGMGIGGFIEHSMSQYKSMGITVVRAEERTISGFPAWFVEYKGDLGGAEPMHAVGLTVMTAPGEFLLTTGISLDSSWSLDGKWLTAGVESFALPK